MIYLRRRFDDRTLRAHLLLVGTLAGALAVGVLAAQEPALALAAVLALLGCVAILAWPHAATLAVIFILFSNAAVVAVRFHDVPYFVGAAAPMLLIVPLASHLIFRHEKLIVTRALPLVFIFLGVQALGTLFATNTGSAMANLSTFAIEGLGLYFLITNVVRTSRMLRLAVWVLLLVGAFLGGLSVYQEITKTYDNNYGGFAQLSAAAFETGDETIHGAVEQRRLAGPLGDQNRYAQNMLMLVPLGLFRFWDERSKLLRALAAVATSLSALGVALTFSRGAAVGLALTLVILTVRGYLKPRHLMLVLAALVLLFAVVPTYRTRLTTLGALTTLTSGESGADGSLRSRATENLAALLVFVDHPVIGVGPGQFGSYYGDYAEIVGLRVLGTERKAHNLYLGLAAETGVLGLGCFLLIVFVTLRSLERTQKRLAASRPASANLANGFLLAIMTYMTTGIFLHFAYVRFFWLMLALASVASYIAETTTDAEPFDDGRTDMRPVLLHPRHSR